MSLPVAERGDKVHLRYLWESGSFDFANACRCHGRNDAFWALCYWTILSGLVLPDEKERKCLVREANRATGGLNTEGERERYTNYEAQQTIEQVANYPNFSSGLKPLVRARRKWAASSRSKYATPHARRLLEVICELATNCARGEEIRASHRQLAARAGLHPTQVAGLLYSLQAAGQVFRLGFTPAYGGHGRGTTRLSLKPPRPAQMIDEAEPPTWDAAQARWVWSTPLAKGSISPSRWRWLARRKPSAAADVPYVYGSLPREENTSSRAFNELLDNPLRGSP